MMTKREGYQHSMISLSMDEMIPADHFLRKLDEIIDFTFIYDELAPYYSKKKGRPSVDPVVMVKQLLLGYVYDIKSERRIEEECTYNVAYRWFLGIRLDERVPDHSTISQLRRRKFNNTDIFKKLFIQVLMTCIDAGLVDGKKLLTDSSHLKANASKESKIKELVECQTQAYFERLDAYEAAYREEEGMPPITRKNPEPKMHEQTKSMTDPEAGWLNRPGKPNGFHFLTHQTIDSKQGIIVDVTVTPGNVSDNVPYIDQLDQAIEVLESQGLEVEAVCADAGYDTAIIHKELYDRDLTVYIPGSNKAGCTKAEFTRHDFMYEPESDCYHCPAGEVLAFKHLQRTEHGIYREYRASTISCKNCPLRAKCLTESQSSRRIQVHIYQKIIDKHRIFLS